MRKATGLLILTVAFIMSFAISAAEIIIDKIDFEDAELNKAVSILSSKCAGKGAVLFSSAGLKQDEMPLVTMSFRNIPLDDLIRYICMETGMKYRKTDNAFIIGKNIDELYIEQYKATVVPATANLANIKECLAAYGVTFPEGSTINYNKKTNTLTVKNNGANHNTISDIFAGADRIDVRRKPATEKDAEFTFTDIRERMKKIRITAEFKNESVKTVLKYIAMKSREKDPSGQGVNILLLTNGSDKSPTISATFTNMTVDHAVSYIATLIGMKCKVEDYAVLIVPKTQPEAPAAQEKTE